MRLATIAFAGLLACSPEPDAAPEERDVPPRDAGRVVLDAREPEVELEPEPEPPEVIDAGAPPVELEVGPLVDPMRWRVVTAEEDPFDRVPDAGCHRAGVMPELLAEELVYSVDTGYCGYITATQPTLHALAPGQPIKVRLWHFALSAPEPAFAHAAVTVDGVPVLDERIPIPSEGGLLVREVPAPRAIPAGAPAFFHLHNHGANSWSLVEVSAQP